MKRITLTTLFFVISICLLSQETYRNTINHQGTERKYIIHIPSSYSPTSELMPLVLCYHGYSSSANIIMSYSGFNDISEEQGFIVVYPQGEIYKRSGKTHWNVGGYTTESKIDDVEFTNNLLDTLCIKYRINKDRIYSTGFSNGGYMSFLLACQLSKRFAAVSSVAGSMTPETFEECNPHHTMPVLLVHGLADKVVPYIGKSWSKPIEETINYWNRINNCDTMIKISFPNRVKEDNSYVTMETHINSSNQISNKYIKIIKGGHEWPGIKESFNINQDTETYKFFSKYNIKGNMDINISSEIWKFFNQYDRNGKIYNP